MAGSQISTSVTILDSLHGFQAVSLTEYSTSAAAAIAAGSVVEIAGAFFTLSGDEAIEASTWTSITTGNTAYITLTASGTAGSQVVVAAYTSTAPTWRDDFQGWYASAASSVRIIGSVYKAEATNYASKHVFDASKQGTTPFTVRSLSVASSLTVAGKSYLNGGMVPSVVVNTITTFSYIYSIISPYIPQTGNTILVNSSQYTAGTIIAYNYAIRSTASTIDFYSSYIALQIDRSAATSIQMLMAF